jgi:hypothetical protein
MEARTWASPLPAPMAAPDPFLHRRLRVADAWLDESGAWLPIAEASNVVLWSILGYLRWHAPALRVHDAEEAGVRDVDAWLASRPLVGAIDEELARRGEAPMGEALATLRAIGSAPWEIPAPSRIKRRGA